MDRTAGTTTTRRVGVIRADPAQTEILRNALVETSNPSPDQLTALSTKTNLPSKWISNWFSRQRAKVNKTNGVRRATHNRLRVKQEALDGVDSPAAASSPATDSVSETTVLIASSSTATLDAILELPPPKARTGTRKRKAEQVSLSDDRGQQTTSLPRELRRKKRKVDEDIQTPPGRRVKAERLEDVEAAPLRYTPVDDAATVLVPGTNLTSVTQWPASIPVVTAPPAYKLPKVAPPQRSPMAAVQPRESARTTPRSGLAKTHIQLQDILSSTGNGETVVPRRRGKGARRGAAASSRRSMHSQEPSFRGQRFQSNFGHTDHGYNENKPPPPSGFQFTQSGGEAQAASGGESSIGRMMSYTLQSDRSGGLYAYDASEDGYMHHQYGVRPLEPAFDWENHNHTPSMGMIGTVLAAPVILKADKERRHTFADNSTYQQPEWNTYPHPTYDQNSASRNSYVPEISSVDSPQVLPTPYADVLDPSKAPLIYLTNILHDFKDENGSYSRLLAAGERQHMMNCLLDDNLLPFEKAMALSFLSRLGFTWN